MDTIKPLKQFGQNYLVDKNIIDKIIREINPVKDDIFLEIGPGQGALTNEIYKQTNKLFAVEIDSRVIENLTAIHPEITIYNSDFLKFNFDSLPLNGQKIRIAGNIPYNITSPILFKLLENRRFIKDCHLMVQYEVAKRIVSGPGNKDYGILSVILGYFSATRLCFKISPNVFFPKPKVDSAIIKLEFKQELPEIDHDLFIQVVKAAFGNRRKTLKNSFGNSIFKRHNFSNSTIDMSLRAETLSIEDFIKLTKEIKANAK